MKRLLVIAAGILTLLVGTFAADALLPLVGASGGFALPDRAQNFITVFLGIFIEAAPFLLFGSLASGFIAVFVTADDIARFTPRNPVLAAILGSLLGIAFPVCECGVVPVVRRLFQKGLPLSAGVAFLLGAPVLNPIVIASTYAAFGFGTVFWARIGLTFLVSAGIGLVFATQPNLVRVLRPSRLSFAMGGLDLPAGGAPEPEPMAQPSRPPYQPGAVQRAFGIAADEFFDIAPYLITGTLLATALQQFVPQQMLVNIGAGPISSVIALSLLAFVLSVCSTVDAFLALSFVNTFTTGAIVAFLVFGPMVDIKSTIMFWGVFRKRIVFYLIALPLLAAVAIGLIINLHLGW